MAWFVVDIECEGSGVDDATEDVMGRLQGALDIESVQGVQAGSDAEEALATLASGGGPLIFGPIVGWGGLAGGANVRASIAATHPLEAAEALADALGRAAEAIGLVRPAISRIDVMTEERHDQELADEPDSFVGVTEIAEILGVSKQRVSELKSHAGFPQPVAELAAGPVWRSSTLNRFVASWARRPGRPGITESYWEQLRALSTIEPLEEVPRSRPLTDREREVLALIASGRSTREIADALGVSDKTLNAHVRSVLGKLRHRESAAQV